ncbi:hypothetical protein FHS61_002048 [Altererythrobacter atlanticus]|uniref:Uncharacterized protein n=1 Tax=Croceibacterium atlanticum TaxID=1267766 RepID=A0A0F7KS25_9SPHN|nr:DOMON-like domain-containing protein [Croceibacterium atlanticum]AKH41560.1 hypothetical protein WYH_00501 [Croceibacterium atlanticum]MBB5733022.1 hypothetical protein [Croceibacterium atlanticum]
MQTYPLLPHPDHPPSRIRSVEAKIIGFDGQWLRLRWRMEGSQAIVIPPFAGKGRADGLWQTTCFELFLKPDGAQAYAEFNLSPSERWAAYDFTSYREGMSERAAPREPDSTIRVGQSMAIFDAAIPAGALPAADCAMGLSAVIEEQGGIKSYWALAHAEGKPDFHAASCFAARLAAPHAA